MLSQPRYAALQDAVSALRRANEYRDAGVLLYEPRYLDAEKTVDAVRTAPGGEFSDISAALKAAQCLSALQAYRLTIEHLEHIGYLSPYPFALSRAAATEAEDQLHEAATNVDTCIKEAEGFL